MQVLYDYMIKPECILEDLDLSGRGFDDATVVPLLNAIKNNRTLKCLNLSGSLRQATNTTWHGIATLLESPASQSPPLEKLSLCYNPINHDALVLFSGALANNNTMSNLLLYNDPEWSTFWREFSRLLCNGTSIMDTYRSNHTLEKIVNHRKQPKDLAVYLEINREYSASDAARQKIITTHFSNGMDVDILIDMELAVLPHAIAWMGRGIPAQLSDPKPKLIPPRNNYWGPQHKPQGGLSFFYECVRKMPLFFDFGAGGNKSENNGPSAKKLKTEK